MKNQTFKRIGLIGKYRDDEALDTLVQVMRFLAEKSLDIILETKTAMAVDNHTQDTLELKDMAKACDLVIVIGGDGNMLTAARTLSNENIPVLGINRGNLGFLTDINPQCFEPEISAVFEGQYRLEKRFLLECQLFRGNELIGSSNALNDVVVSQAGMGKMMEFEVYINEQFLYSQRSDGLITATPTGSTAYALSANGPILHPELDAMTLVPMCPHTLSSRPIVIDAQNEIKIVISTNNEIYPKLSCDGQVHFSTAPGDIVTIKKHQHRLNLIHPLTTCYFETLRTKLQWGQKL